MTARMGERAKPSPVMPSSRGSSELSRHLQQLYVLLHLRSTSRCALHAAICPVQRNHIKSAPRQVGLLRCLSIQRPPKFGVQTGQP